MPSGRSERQPASLQRSFDDLRVELEASSRFVRAVREEVYVRSPAEAAHHLMAEVYFPFHKFDQEEMYVLLLDTKNRVTHEVMIYRGTLNTVYVRVAEIFKEAIRMNAASIIVAHCHPSGEPTPSPEDVRITERAVEVGRQLDIDILDHIIVGKGRWVSLKERGLGFKP